MTSQNNQNNIPAKSCAMSKFLLTVVVLYGVQCCNGFTLTRSVSSCSSSFDRKWKESTTKLDLSPYKNYEIDNDDDEMTGPFFFSGEPTVDDTSLGRLETLYDKPDTTTTATTPPTTTSTLEERIQELRERIEDNNDGEDQDSWQ